MTQSQDLTQLTHPVSLHKTIPGSELQHPCLSFIRNHWISWPERSLVLGGGSVPLALVQKQHSIQNLGNLCSWQNSPKWNPGSLPILTTFCCQLGILIKYVTETITTYCFTSQETRFVEHILLRSLSISAEVCLRGSNTKSSSEWNM